MQLTYRGIRYDYNPPRVALKNTEEVGKYRGVDIRCRTIKKNSVQQPTLDLVYRGVAYRTGGAASAAEPTIAPAPASPETSPSNLSTQEKARLMLASHHQLVKRRQQSMLSRLAKEVGLTADVTQYWNRIQGKVHPSFWATYDRSRATIS